MKKINSSEITPESAYMSRRRFIKGAAGLTASALVLAACGRNQTGPEVIESATPITTGSPFPTATPLPTPVIEGTT